MQFHIVIMSYHKEKGNLRISKHSTCIRNGYSIILTYLYTYKCEIDLAN